MSQALSSTRTRYLLLLPLPLIVGLFYVLPFAGIIGWSVTLPELGLDNYARVLSDGSIHDVLWRTLRVCSAVSVIALAGAYLLAYSWLFSPAWLQRLIEIGVFLPFWLSVLVRTFGWLIALRGNGLLNSWLMASGLIDSPLSLVRNETGVIIGMVHFMIPFAFFPILSSMRQIDQRTLLAARGLGAGRLRTFCSVFVPQTLQGVCGAFIMVFVFCLGFFIVPVLLGGGQTVMIAEYIFLQMFQTSNWGLGAALSVILLALVLLLTWLLLKITRVDRNLAA